MLNVSAPYIEEEVFVDRSLLTLLWQVSLQNRVLPNLTLQSSGCKFSKSWNDNNLHILVGEALSNVTSSDTYKLSTSKEISQEFNCALSIRGKVILSLR